MQLKPDIPRKDPTLVHMLNRSSRKLLTSLLQSPDESSLYQAGYKIDMLTFYDQQISSQLSLGNSSGLEANKDFIKSFLGRFGWGCTENDQTICAIKNQALLDLLDKRIKDIQCENIEGAIKQVTSSEDGEIIELEDGLQIKAKTILTTEDLETKIQGFPQTEITSSYYQQKIASSFCSIPEELHEAYIRSIPGGFITMIPTKEKEVLIKYCFAKEHDYLSKLDPVAYIKHINQKLQEVAKYDTQCCTKTPISYPPQILSENTERSLESAFWKHIYMPVKGNFFMFGIYQFNIIKNR